MKYESPIQAERKHIFYWPCYLMCCKCCRNNKPVVKKSKKKNDSDDDDDDNDIDNSVNEASLSNRSVLHHTLLDFVVDAHTLWLQSLF